VVLQNIGVSEIVQDVQNRKEVNDAIQIYIGVIIDYTQRLPTIGHVFRGNTRGLTYGYISY